MLDLGTSTLELLIELDDSTLDEIADETGTGLELLEDFAFFDELEFLVDEELIMSILFENEIGVILDRENGMSGYSLEDVNTIIALSSEEL